MSSNLPDLTMAKRVTNSQLDILLNFLQKHPILNQGVVVGKAKLTVKKLWSQVAAKLNTDKDGAQKDALHWKRYWINMKNKVKTKTITLTRERKEGVKRLSHLNEFDKRALAIIAKGGKLVTPSGDHLQISDVQDSDGSDLDDKYFNDFENDATMDLSVETADKVDIEQYNGTMNEEEYDNCRPRVSAHQLELLVQFMERFPKLANTRGRGRIEQQRAARSWDKIAMALNKVDVGVGNKKNGHGWLRYWTSLKCGIRMRYLSSQRGAGNDAQEPQFSPIQNRILNIITGDDDEPAMTQMKHEDCDIQPTEQVDVKSSLVKVESIEEDEDEDQKNCPSEDQEDLIEDPIDTTIKSNKEVKIKKMKQEMALLRIQLEKERDRAKLDMAREKEMHDLQIKHQKERHALEMEILELKKKKLILEYNRNKKLHITIQNSSQIVD